MGLENLKPKVLMALVFEFSIQLFGHLSNGGPDSRPGIVGSGHSFHLDVVILPVDAPIILFDQLGVGGLSVVLRSGIELFFQIDRNGSDQDFPPDLGEFGHGGGRGFGGAKGYFFLGNNRPMVHLLIHQHNGHSGFRVSVQDRRLDRRSSPVLGKQRRMNV